MNEQDNTNNGTQEYDAISKAINRKKLKFYSKSKIMVHIKLRSGDFRNGFIIEESIPEVWKMKERKLGEINLFEDEVKKIEDYTELDNKENKK